MFSRRRATGFRLSGVSFVSHSMNQGRSDSGRAVTRSPGGRPDRLREQRHLTQAELAELAGVSPSAISQAEAGHRGLSLDTVATLAERLQLSIDDLLASQPDADYLLARREHAAGRCGSGPSLDSPDRSGFGPTSSNSHPVRPAFRGFPTKGSSSSSSLPESCRSTWGRTCRSCDLATRCSRHGWESQGGATCSVSLPDSSGSSETETRHVSAGSMWTVDIHSHCAAVHTANVRHPPRRIPWPEPCWTSLSTEICPASRLFDEDSAAPTNPCRRDDTPSGDRRRRAQELVARAGGRREPLERMLAGYQRRLHAASDDFDATDALRVVELALSVVGRSDGPWTAQSREAHAPWQWWRHRRNP